MYVIADMNTGEKLLRADTRDELIEKAIKINEESDFDLFGFTYIGKEKKAPIKESKFVWIFLDKVNENYIAIPERDLTDKARYIIEGKGFDLFADSVLEGEVKSYMAKKAFYAKPVKYEVVPVTLKEAQQFVDQYHRHHKQPQGHKFSIGLQINNKLIGVVIAGRPVSRHLDNKQTLEVTRCCVIEGFKNAVSKLYSSVCKAAKAFGYKKVITYTLATETGSSMKAVGFMLDVISDGGSWNSKSRPRIDKHPTTPKFRWVKNLN
ncbi:XF1762 family protein [Lysinibacillus sphaericus]|uniref:XF1762 family protein n=1 Tax=Lysinibacillus sphaericus TaxID=1421 RepID=UPI001C558E4F|nr:XF1762 family protein [Lysinibacillus sphaericus]